MKFQADWYRRARHSQEARSNFLNLPTSQDHSNQFREACFNFLEGRKKSARLRLTTP